MKMAHAMVPHGWTKKRRITKRVSAGTWPYQITRYCEKKKYIQNTQSAKVSLATSWIAGGATRVSPRSLERIVR